MKQEKLISIRENTLKGLKNAEASDTKLILEVIAKSYTKDLIPDPNEDNKEDKCIRFLFNELNFLINNM